MPGPFSLPICPHTNCPWRCSPPICCSIIRRLIETGPRKGKAKPKTMSPRRPKHGRHHSSVDRMLLVGLGTSS